MYRLWYLQVNEICPTLPSDFNDNNEDVTHNLTSTEDFFYFDVEKVGSGNSI